MLLTILAFIAILLALVLVHEWGHFFAARRLGIGVEEFGFGFPPRAACLVRGGVRYSLNWLPLGGFVRLKGEQGGNTDPDSFGAQSAWCRAVVLLAGVSMNVVLAFLLLTIGFASGVPSVVEDADLAVARDVFVQVTDVAPGSPAAAAGIVVGDRVLQLDSQRISTTSDVQDYVRQHAGVPVAVTVGKHGEQRTISVTPQVLAESNGRAVMGVSLLRTGLIRYPWYQAAWRAAGATLRLTWEIIRAFGLLVYNLVVQRQVPADLAGPVGIAVLTGEVVSLGWTYILQFAALLSLNLAIINVLPFPALDGGRLLFVAIEKLRGSPVDSRTEALVHNIGFTFLMLLVLAVTYHDFAQLGGSLWGGISRFTW